MAYYLQMDGVDDYLKTPSMTFTKIVMDFKARQTAGASRVYFDSRSGFSFGYVQRTTGNVDTIGNTGQMTVKVNSSTVTNNTAFIPYDTRVTLESTWSTAAADDVNIFSSSTATAFMPGDIYDVAFYNGASLVAHYDMTLGNVQDQSGNGRHATLTGGTWVSDGGSGTVGSTPYATKQTINQISTVAVATKQTISQTISISYATKQSVSQTVSILYATKQVINRVGSTSYATQQRISLTTATAYATKQALYQVGSVSYASQQTITSGGVPGSVAYATKQKIYSSIGAVNLATKQTLYQSGSTSYSTEQVIYDLNSQIVDRISLIGTRELYKSLRGERVLHVTLRGDLMTAEKQDIDLYPGESRIVDIPFKESDGSPIPLSGATVKWVLKKNPKTVELLQKNIGSGLELNESGVMLNIVKADTNDLQPGIYFHVVELTDALGHESIMLRGSFTLKSGGI